MGRLAKYPVLASIVEAAAKPAGACPCRLCHKNPAQLSDKLRLCPDCAEDVGFARGLGLDYASVAKVLSSEGEPSSLQLNPRTSDGLDMGTVELKRKTQSTDGTPYVQIGNEKENFNLTDKEIPQVIEFLTKALEENLAASRKAKGPG
jgi:hypothetical protein